MQSGCFWRIGFMVLAMAAALRADPVVDGVPAVEPTAETPAKPTVLNGSVRKITVNHGNLITTVTAKDMEALGVAVGANFTLKIGESTYTVKYDKTYESVPAGGWVAVAKAGELIWIARNGENAAETAKAEVDTKLEIQPLPETP